MATLEAGAVTLMPELPKSTPKYRFNWDWPAVNPNVCDSLSAV